MAKVEDGKTVEHCIKSEHACQFCRKPGHHIKQCPDPRCKVSKSPTPTRFVSTAHFTKPVASIFNVTSDPTADLFEPSRCSGTVSLSSDSETHPIRIMRDTASGQSLLLISALPKVENNYIREKVTLRTFMVRSRFVLLECISVAVWSEVLLP